MQHECHRHVAVNIHVMSSIICMPVNSDINWHCLLVLQMLTRPSILSAASLTPNVIYQYLSPTFNYYWPWVLNFKYFHCILVFCINFHQCWQQNDNVTISLNFSLCLCGYIQKKSIVKGVSSPVGTRACYSETSK